MYVFDENSERNLTELLRNHKQLVNIANSPVNKLRF